MVRREPVIDCTEVQLPLDESLVRPVWRWRSEAWKVARLLDHELLVFFVFVFVFVELQALLHLKNKKK